MARSSLRAEEEAASWKLVDGSQGPSCSLRRRGSFAGHQSLESLNRCLKSEQHFQRQELLCLNAASAKSDAPDTGSFRRLPRVQCIKCKKLRDVTPHQFGLLKGLPFMCRVAQKWGSSLSCETPQEAGAEPPASWRQKFEPEDFSWVVAPKGNVYYISPTGVRINNLLQLQPCLQHHNSSLLPDQCLTAHSFCFDKQTFWELHASDPKPKPPPPDRPCFKNAVTKAGHGRPKGASENVDLVQKPNMGEVASRSADADGALPLPKAPEDDRDTCQATLAGEDEARICTGEASRRVEAGAKVGGGQVPVLDLSSPRFDQGANAAVLDVQAASPSSSGLVAVPAAEDFRSPLQDSPAGSVDSLPIARRASRRASTRGRQVVSSTESSPRADRLARTASDEAIGVRLDKKRTGQRNESTGETGGGSVSPASARRGLWSATHAVRGGGHRASLRLRSTESAERPVLPAGEDLLTVGRKGSEAAAVNLAEMRVAMSRGLSVMPSRLNQPRPTTREGSNGAAAGRQGEEEDQGVHGADGKGRAMGASKDDKGAPVRAISRDTSRRGTAAASNNNVSIVQDNGEQAQDGGLPPLKLTEYLLKAGDEPFDLWRLPLLEAKQGRPGVEPEEAVYILGKDEGNQAMQRRVKGWSIDLRKTEKESRLRVQLADRTWVDLGKARSAYSAGRACQLLIPILLLAQKSGLASAKKLAELLYKDRQRLMLRTVLEEVEVGSLEHIARSCLPQIPAVHGREWLRVLTSLLGNSSSKKGQDDSSFVCDTKEEEEEEQEEEGEEAMEGGESVCYICDDGGEIMVCDGPCMRSFHPSADEGCPGIQGSLRLSDDEVAALKQSPFICPNCHTGKHLCFICHELGASGGPAPELILCSAALCGHYYHPRCIEQWAKKHPGSVTARSAEEALAASREGDFVCPRHTCLDCKLTGSRKRKAKDSVMVPCRRCPKVYHAACVPPELPRPGEAGQRVWGVPLSQEGFAPLLYCLDHDIDEEVGAPRRTHHCFPEDQRTRAKSKGAGDVSEQELGGALQDEVEEEESDAERGERRGAGERRGRKRSKKVILDAESPDEEEGGKEGARQRHRGHPDEDVAKVERILARQDVRHALLEGTLQSRLVAGSQDRPRNAGQPEPAAASGWVHSLSEVRSICQAAARAVAKASLHEHTEETQISPSPRPASALPLPLCRQEVEARIRPSHVSKLIRWNTSLRRYLGPYLEFIQPVEPPQPPAPLPAAQGPLDQRRGPLSEAFPVPQEEVESRTKKPHEPLRLCPVETAAVEGGGAAASSKGREQEGGAASVRDAAGATRKRTEPEGQDQRQMEKLVAGRLYKSFSDVRKRVKHTAQVVVNAPRPLDTRGLSQGGQQGQPQQPRSQLHGIQQTEQVGELQKPNSALGKQRASGSLASQTQGSKGIKRGNVAGGASARSGGTTAGGARPRDERSTQGEGGAGLRMRAAGNGEEGTSRQEALLRQLTSGDRQGSMGRARKDAGRMAGTPPQSPRAARGLPELRRSRSSGSQPAEASGSENVRVPQSLRQARVNLQLDEIARLRARKEAAANAGRGTRQEGAGEGRSVEWAQRRADVLVRERRGREKEGGQGGTRGGAQGEGRDREERGGRVHREARPRDRGVEAERGDSERRGREREEARNREQQEPRRRERGEAGERGQGGEAASREQQEPRGRERGEVGDRGQGGETVNREQQEPRGRERGEAGNREQQEPRGREGPVPREKERAGLQKRRWDVRGDDSAEGNRVAAASKKRRWDVGPVQGTGTQGTTLSAPKGRVGGGGEGAGAAAGSVAGFSSTDHGRSAQPNGHANALENPGSGHTSELEEGEMPGTWDSQDHTTESRSHAEEPIATRGFQGYAMCSGIHAGAMQAGALDPYNFAQWDAGAQYTAQHPMQYDRPGNGVSPQRAHRVEWTVSVVPQVDASAAMHPPGMHPPGIPPHGIPPHSAAAGTANGPLPPRDGFPGVLTGLQPPPATTYLHPGTESMSAGSGCPDESCQDMDMHLSPPGSGSPPVAPAPQHQMFTVSAEVVLANLAARAPGGYAASPGEQGQGVQPQFVPLGQPGQFVPLGRPGQFAPGGPQVQWGEAGYVPLGIPIPPVPSSQPSPSHLSGPSSQPSPSHLSGPSSQPSPPGQPRALNLPRPLSPPSMDEVAGQLPGHMHAWGHPAVYPHPQPPATGFVSGGTRHPFLPPGSQ